MSKCDEVRCEVEQCSAVLSAVTTRVTNLSDLYKVKALITTCKVQTQTNNVYDKPRATLITTCDKVQTLNNNVYECSVNINNIIFLGIAVRISANKK